MYMYCVCTDQVVQAMPGLNLTLSHAKEFQSYIFISLG
jgi:hypothetical protein